MLRKLFYKIVKIVKPNSFLSLGLSFRVCDIVKQMGYKNPTPVQQQSIPIILRGRDILASAQTGSGKTGAFAIPIIEKLLKYPKREALIISPTRELSEQTEQVFKTMLKDTNIQTILLIGGEDIEPQLEGLKKSPRVIIGTPGRINDHLKRKTLKLYRVRYVVLDETDKMLDMGFADQIKAIFRHTSARKRQTLMFSATFPHEIMSMAKRYLKKPEKVNIGRRNSVSNDIDQEIVKIFKKNKFEFLKKIMREREGTCIIFVRTQKAVEILENKISPFFSVVSIHGGYKQERRNKAIEEFRTGKIKALIATDVAARGLDISHIDNVINYDLPEVPENYVHRIGRTGRAGKKGYAVSFITPDTIEQWEDIEKFMAGKKADGYKKRLKEIIERYEREKEKKRQQKRLEEMQKRGNLITPQQKSKQINGNIISVSNEVEVNGNLIDEEEKEINGNLIDPIETSKQKEINGNLL